MASRQRDAKLVAVVLACCATWAPAQSRKEFRYTLGPGAHIDVVNEFGPVTVVPSTGGQVLVTATLHSNKVEVDESRNGNRLDLHTHFLQNSRPEEGRVDYELQVPPDASLSVRSATGPIRAQGLHGDILLEADAAPVEAKDLNNATLHVRTLNGPVTLSSIAHARVDVTSVGGDVTLVDVDGPKVSINTTSGRIRYTGDFGGGGDYSLSNHSGDIDVSLPANASVDITARSVNGSVQNDFPFREKTHTPFPLTQGRSFAGTSNTAASSVRVRSFSGKIRLQRH